MVLFVLTVTATPVFAQAVINPSAKPATARHHAKGDPFEKTNRSLFAVHQALDRTLFRPVAMGFKAVVPRFVRTGIRHLLSNIGEPVVFVNDLLQLRPGRAARTLVRFSVNTTLGIGGVLDLAAHENLPHHDNGFGNTLGRYGVGPGPYVFLPLVGPSTLRDLFGGRLDDSLLPATIGMPFDRAEYQIPTVVIGGLDLRVESDADLKVLLDGAVDPYATLRSVYLQSRAADIAALRDRGSEVATDALGDPLADPAATAPALDTPADPLVPPTVPPGSSNSFADPAGTPSSPPADTAIDLQPPTSPPSAP